MRALTKGEYIRYSELDSLRGVAALLVVLFHFTMGKNQADLGFKLGTTGVDLFFIISGFVISMSIERVSSGLEFVINRASRLYPTYWASVTVTFIVISIYTFYKQGFVRVTDYLGNLTMFQYYLNIPNLDDPYWTMIVEMLFYMFILILFYTRLLNYIILIGCIIAGSVLFISIFYWDRFIGVFKALPILEFFPLFFAGIIFYKIIKEKSNHFFSYLLLIGCLVTEVLLFNHAGRSKEFISQSEYAVMLVIYFGFFILFVNGKLKLITIKPLLFLGKISFALYLTHQYIFVGHVLPFLLNRLNWNFWFSIICIGLPLSLGLAAAITYYIEIPYSKKMRQRLSLMLLGGAKTTKL
jgi:peptidoglycan/LPS O-acetylase OafA/YrhL